MSVPQFDETNSVAQYMKQIEKYKNGTPKRSKVHANVPTYEDGQSIHDYMQKIENYRRRPKKDNIDTTSLEMPTYDDSDDNDVTCTKYISDVEKFKLDLIGKKYSLVLDFINEWLNLSEKTKLQSLTDFQKIEKEQLLINPAHNRKILKRHCKKLKEELGINLQIEEDTDSDKIDDEYILFFASRMLNSIGYGFRYQGAFYNKLYTIRVN